MIVTAAKSRLKRILFTARRQGTVWLAVFAVLAQVLMPFGQALALGANADYEYQVICTATGITQVAVGADGQPIEPLDVPKSCPFCFLHSSVVLLQPEQVPTPGMRMVVVPVAFEHPAHQRTASIWRGSPQPSRAPPVSI
ncbi:DUF2946 domain-containing protein [Magnetovibrio sp.]|uniref:DUF2946 domain-containing protein n=1 Tax=Magnetovibrio sp. TaxID=2024836 RepID=UPI002F94F7BA